MISALDTRLLHRNIPIQIKESVDHDQLRTFNHMASRRLKRKYNGVYKKYKGWTRPLIFVLLASWLGVFTLHRSTDATDASGTSVNLSINLYSNVAILIVISVVLSLEISVLLEWMMCWLLLGSVFFLIMTGGTPSLTGNSTNSDNPQKVGIIITITIFAELFTIIIYCVSHFLYPWAVKNGYIEPVWWWKIKSLDLNGKIGFSYESRGWFIQQPKKYIVYKGEMDQKQRPQGCGKWVDTSFHGEHLEGWWDKGVPVGPFTSREGGSGYTFSSVLVAVCHNRAEKSWSSSKFFPAHSSNGLQWGMASVECSISGSFYRFLPAVEEISDGNNFKSAKDCFQYLNKPLVGGITKRFTGRSIVEKSAVEPTQINTHSKELSSLEAGGVHDNTLKAGDSQEALVFLHGFNCPMEYALKRLSQLLCLGNMPKTLFPFVFSWPAGSGLTYPQAIQIGTESKRTREDFIAFLRSLREAGFDQINIVAHSMGARVLFNALPDFDELFVVKEETVSNENKMKLSTVLLLNPDYPLDDFVQLDGGFDLLSQYCDHTSLYGDRQDGALWYSEMFTLFQNRGKKQKSLGKNIRNISRIGDNETEEGFDLNDLFGDDNIVQHEFLDMDVIDTTWMDNNVHSMRHNYFNINPTLVDDLFQVLVDKTRAWQRKNLIKTTGNVYIFSIAPAYITNS